MMQVVNDNIILKEEKRNDTTEGGLYVPTQARNTNIIRKGTILEVGLGCPQDGTDEDLKPGQEVLFDVRDGIDMQINGESFVVIKFEKLVAVLEN
jgi:co-chaperonin GroES (HSP10)